MFGNFSPFSKAHRTSSFSFGSNFGRPQAKKQPAIEYDLYVTLEEILHGATKRMKISRKVVEQDGTSRTEEKNLSVRINPGWREGTKVTFHKEGDQIPGSIPADIVFTIRDKTHKHFKRENATDIRYNAKITLREALCGSIIYVPTLGTAQFKLTVHKIITPNMIKRIAGEGKLFFKIFLF